MKSPGDGARLVLRGIADGSGRPHDLYIEPGEGQVTLSCPGAFWSFTFSPAQGDVLAPAIQDASDQACQQLTP